MGWSGGQTGASYLWKLAIFCVNISTNLTLQPISKVTKVSKVRNPICKLPPHIYSWFITQEPQIKSFMTMAVKQPVRFLGKWSPQGHATHKPDKEDDCIPGHSPLNFLWGYFWEAELMKWLEKQCWSFTSTFCTPSSVFGPDKFTESSVRPRLGISVFRRLTAFYLIFKVFWCID